MSAQWYDANVSLPGCDKNMPGTLMAMGRLNRPSLMVYGGTIKPGHSSTGATLDIVSAFQSYGPSAPSDVPVTTRCYRDARSYAVVPLTPSFTPARSHGDVSLPLSL
jgi:dihydroxy-acid dehydratase